MSKPLDRATVEQMMASEFRPDDELIDALAEDWLRQEEALPVVKTERGVFLAYARYYPNLRLKEVT